MGRYSSFPLIFDELLWLDIRSLKRLGFLQLSCSRTGNVNWTNEEGRIASITICSTIHDYNGSLRLTYTSSGEKRTYTIHLTSTESNLGFGRIWYFRCPATSKRCRKLHLIDGYFVHRSTILSGFYRSQLGSRYKDSLFLQASALFQLDDYYEEMNSKYFKSSYAGVLTKRYLRIKEKVNRLEQVLNQQEQ